MLSKTRDGGGTWASGGGDGGHIIEQGQRKTARCEAEGERE